MIEYVLSTDVEGESRYELVGITASDGIVFTLGDDDEEEDGAYGERIPLRNDSTRPRTDSLLLQQHPSGTAPSRMSSGSDGTLHDEPMEMESPRPKYQQQRGAFDHHSHLDSRGIEGAEEQGRHETTVWVPKEDGMTIERFGEICLTWIRRSQVIIAYITVLAGFVVYTVRSPGSSL